MTIIKIICTLIKHAPSLQYLYVISWHGVYPGGDDAVEVYIDTADVLYAAQHTLNNIPLIYNQFCYIIQLYNKNQIIE